MYKPSKPVFGPERPGGPSTSTAGPVSSRLPLGSDFPENVVLSIVPPPGQDAPTNVLILLHGIGDTHDSFAKLAKQMNLPETVCIAVQGPMALLDLGGHHWGDDIIFDSGNNGIDADAGFRQSTALLKLLIIDILRLKCGYKAREVMLFGFGQGGMACVSTAIALHEATSEMAASELGGVVSIGGPIPTETPAALQPKCKTPVLVCAGSDQSLVTTTSEEKLKHVFEHVEVKRYKRPGDKMPANRDEMLPIMQFFSRRLRSTKGVPAGSIEVS